MTAFITYSLRQIFSILYATDLHCPRFIMARYDTSCVKRSQGEGNDTFYHFSSLRLGGTLCSALSNSVTVTITGIRIQKYFDQSQ